MNLIRVIAALACVAPAWAGANTSQQDLDALAHQIDASEKGQSSDARAEYKRRLSLLPTIKDWQANGNPNDHDAVSLKQLNDELAEVTAGIAEANKNLLRIQAAPVEYAALLIVTVPGPTVPLLNNPTREQVRQILAERKTYWQDKRNACLKSIDTARRMRGSGDATVRDEFGDSHPESLTLWLKSETSKAWDYRRTANRYLAALDENAVVINGSLGSNLPILSGLSLNDLPEGLKTYRDRLSAVKIPQYDRATDTLSVVTNIGQANTLLPCATRSVILWNEAGTRADKIRGMLTDILPRMEAAHANQLSIIDSVLSDTDQDVSFLGNAGAGESGQALITRKSSLLQNEILPNLLERWNDLSILTARYQALFSSLQAEAEILKEKTELLDDLDGGLQSVNPSIQPYGNNSRPSNDQENLPYGNKKISSRIEEISKSLSHQ